VRRKRILAVFVGLVLCTGLAGWLCRDFLQAKYFVFRLNRAADHEVETWVEQSAEWGSAVAPALLAQMIVDDAERCRRAGAALDRMHDDESSQQLVGLVQARFDSLSPAGQEWALQQVAVRDAPSEESRRMIESAVRSASASIRRQAIRSALACDRHELVAPLINDPDTEVRRAVVLALGPNRDWLSDDDLLPRLHDADREVQRVTRLALLSRGLTDVQVRFGRLLTDPTPSARLELIGQLRDDSELDLREWLSRLSRDPSPAVRAAAARTAAELRIFQLTSRLSELAAKDPESTVRQIAQFHLRQMRSGTESSEP
jgi:HEAT repeat protein